MANRSTQSENTLLLIGAPEINNLDKSTFKDVEVVDDADDRQCVEHQHPGQKNKPPGPITPKNTLSGASASP